MTGSGGIEGKQREKREGKKRKREGQLQFKGKCDLFLREASRSKFGVPLLK